MAAPRTPKAETKKPKSKAKKPKRKAPEKQWLTYEGFTVKLLNDVAEEFGLESVQGEQIIQGKRSGTTYKIEGKGIIKGGKGFLIVECRRYTRSRQSQQKLGELAYRILDSGADGAILVSRMGLQKGAKMIAASEKITSVQLREGSTTLNEFVMEFLDKIRIGLSGIIGTSGRITPRLMRVCTQCGKSFPEAEHETLCSDCR
jgi:hypothetical protein